MSQIFEDIFESSPLAKILVRSNGQIFIVNKQAEKLFGYKRDEMIDRPIEILVPEVSREKHPALFKEYLNSPLPRQMGRDRKLFGVRKDGGMIPVEIGLSPIMINNELFIVSYILDISEQKRAEERFRAAVEAAPNGMLMINSSRKIILVNKKIEEIFGYSRNELINQDIEILVPDDFKPPHPKFVENYLKKPETRSMGIGRELFGKHKNGKPVPVEIGLQPITTDGEICVISSVVDISFRRHTEIELSRKTKEIEEFSYRTSHDLKTPLKSIAAMADCSLENIEDNLIDDAIADIKSIKNLSYKLLTLIDSILKLTKVEVEDENSIEFDFKEFETLFREKYSSLLKNNNVELSTAFLHRHKLIIQATRLTQVLDNLLSNGIKYCNQTLKDRKVELHTFNDSGKFIIRISDNGLGIPENRHKEVYGMFKRFHDGSIEGTGLGLYLVRKQISKLNATISFESSPDGTIFYIEIPIH